MAFVAMDALDVDDDVEVGSLIMVGRFDRLLDQGDD